MDLQDYFAYRRVYEQRARDRTSEYLNSGIADTTFGERVAIEMFIDCIDRMHKLESLLKGDEPVKKSKFSIG